jgi:hypothetical protein
MTVERKIGTAAGGLLYVVIRITEGDSYYEGKGYS